MIRIPSLRAFAVLLPLTLLACGGEHDAMYANDSAANGGSSDSASPGGSGTGGSSPGSGGTSGASGTGGIGSTSGGAPGEGSGDAAPGTSSGEPGTSSGSVPQSGQLTAGMWDDNRNYSFFTRYLDQRAGQGSQSQQQQPSNELLWSRGEHEAAFRRWSNPRATREQLDVALVLDTTGSMGDELRYLQSEFNSIVARVQESHPNTQQRWSLIVYRDQGDAYVVRTYDFTSDLTAFQRTLAQQGFNGGGDTPEAAHEALTAASEDLSWRREATASRIAFWVADAPPHAQNYAALGRAVSDLAQNDIRVYPVAASSADGETEYLMRGAAQLTGGRYAFLTDDSGIGNAHVEPEVPCYHVTRFDQALLRAIDHELAGVSSQPAAGQIIRSVGSPVNGVCATSRGQAYAY